MFSRVIVISLVLTLVTSFAHAADPYDAIIDRLDERYDDIKCSAESESIFLRTIRMHDVTCAFEKIAGTRPSAKYVALLAFANQRFLDMGTTQNYSKTRKEHGHSSQGGTAQKIMITRVIQQLQAYGACSPFKNEPDGRASISGGYGDTPPNDILDLVYKSISGSAATKIPIIQDGKIIGYENSVGYGDKEAAALAKYFGFNNIREIDDLFRDPDFNSSTPAQRQSSFVERIPNSLGNRSATGDALRECFAQLGQKRRGNPKFNMKNEAENADLCFFMASENRTANLDLSICEKTLARVTPARPPTSVPIIREVPVRR